MANYEVLQCLRSNAAYRTQHVTQEAPAKVKLEDQVRRYLNSTPAHTQQREPLEALLKSLDQYGLSKAERLQIVNLMPTQLVELYLIVSKIEERFSEDEIARLLEIILQARH
jgi:DNA-directed RNA polymerase subunit F